MKHTLPRYSWTKQCISKDSTRCKSWTICSSTLMKCKEDVIEENSHIWPRIELQFWTQEVIVITLPNFLWARYYVSRDSTGFKSWIRRECLVSTKPMTHEEGILGGASYSKARIITQIWTQNGIVTMKRNCWAAEKMKCTFHILVVSRFSRHDNAILQSNDMISTGFKIIMKKVQYGKPRYTLVDCGYFCNVLCYCFSHFIVHNVILILSIILKNDNRDDVISLDRQLYFLDSLTLCFINV